MRIRIRAVVNDLATDRSGIALIKDDTGAWITAEFADIKSDDISGAGHDRRSSLEHDRSVVEAQRIVFSADLVHRFKPHVFQRQICIVLNDALDVIRIGRNVDRPVLKGDRRVLQQLETVCLRRRRTRTRSAQRIHMTAEIQGKVLSALHGDSGGIRHIPQQGDRLSIRDRFDCFIQRRIFRGSDFCCITNCSRYFRRCDRKHGKDHRKA